MTPLSERRAQAARLLQDPATAALSFREIARRCGLSPTTVAKIAASLSVQNGQIKVSRGDSTYEVERPRRRVPQVRAEDRRRLKIQRSIHDLTLDPSFTPSVVEPKRGEVLGLWVPVTSPEFDQVARALGLSPMNEDLALARRFVADVFFTGPAKATLQRRFVHVRWLAWIEAARVKSRAPEWDEADLMTALATIGMTVDGGGTVVRGLVPKDELIA